MAQSKQLTQHSSGTWAADPELRLSNGGSLAVTRLNPDGSRLVIAEVWKTNDRIPLLRDDNAAQANARLIAAAPELLEAAKGALVAFDYHDQQAEANHHSIQRKALRQAIAKAEQA